ncbi:cyclase family protein [Pseudemcibacter aquimaris]|uniref:cyclase family protein n=1 Tax=Pseudemcibacter aquimaris TaxID=2857064 RepID=UPI0020134B50|nr:cyclase family protein [Pseudemcibacter aquimaris]MCC3862080.1 cyclase family protein [Pseudemcibacter aquimaris]WDU58833.1 cyclase family protein [Pseudemcibacter aquimaris]
MKSWLNLFFVGIAAMGGYLAAVSNLSSGNQNTPQVQSADLGSILAKATLVDLTHTMEEGMPPGPSGDTPPTITPVAPREDGTSGIHRYNFPGQWGTHVDPPVHFVGGLRDLEDIALSEMILPLIVIDVHEKVEADPDYQVSMSDVYAWEEKHGPVPANSFVALRTDWSKRWPSLERMRNRDANDVSHSPGWSREVIDYLVLNQKVTAIGHETLDTDPGKIAGTGNWPLQTYYMGLDKYQIENMTNLDQVPENGAYIVATWAKPQNGSGFPARVFAIIPNNE